MSRPPFNLQAVEAVTPLAVSSGHHVMQTHYYADTPERHVAQLLDWMQPAAHATVLDAGCGIGEVSRLMAEARPDLGFVLVNISPFQLSLCPEGERFLRVCADCHAMTDIADGSVQAVMYSSALCQMDTEVALAEAHRVLDEGGVLLINDMVRTGSDGQRIEQMLAARVLTEQELIRFVEGAGFTMDFAIKPAGSDAHFRALLIDAGIEDIIEGIGPFVIRATKRGTL